MIAVVGCCERRVTNRATPGPCPFSPGITWFVFLLLAASSDPCAIVSAFAFPGLFLKHNHLSTALTPYFKVQGTSFLTLLILQNGGGRADLFAASISLFGILAIIVYKISFHPLSQYPGPKLAAATGGYRIYYEIWKSGRMIQQLEALHKQYGKFLQ